MYFNEKFSDIKKISDEIFSNPELGYKEVETSRRVLDFLKKENPDLDYEIFSGTGIKTYLSKDKARTLVYLAELDAVYAPTHFMADKETGAAHNCGHHTQVAIGLSLYSHYMKTGEHLNYDFNICFVFVPAEEYLDLDYRKKLVEEGKISYFGGKPEAMKLGIFDDADLVMCAHAIGEEFQEPTIEIDCDLVGFLYKRYDFFGQASHAGFDPFSGVNAYSISSLFNVSLGLLRQQLKDYELIRFNPIVAKSDMSTNVIPNRVTIGTDLRARSVDYLKETATKLDRAAKGSAYSLNGQVEIRTQMGYLPFIQDEYLCDFALEAFEKNKEIPNLIKDRGVMAAAGDIGDLSFMRPSIQIGYGGFKGTIHGDDFNTDDEEFIFVTFPRYLSEVIREFDGRLDEDKLYKRSYEEYEELINSIL